MIHEAQINAIMQRSHEYEPSENNLCTTYCFKNKKNKIKAQMISNQDQIICGTTLVKAIFNHHCKNSHFDIKTADSLYAKKGQVVLTLEAYPLDILHFKKLALYYLSRMSAITNLTKKYCFLLENTKTNLVECRFFSPEMRVIEKEATFLGGVMSYKRFFKKTVAIEREHIKCNETITSIVNQLEESLPPTTRIEVHVSTLEEVKEASDLGIDLIVLIDFKIPSIKMAQRINQNKSRFEVTGDLTLDDVRDLAPLGLDFISTDLLIKESGFAPFSFEIIS